MKIYSNRADKKCVKRMPFEWLSNEGLQEYYEFLYGIKVEVKE